MSDSTAIQRTTGYEKSRALLNRMLPGTNLRYERTEISSVTTEWGVKWDEELIARDITQNFYDANRTRIADVGIEIDGHDVTISAPTSFDLERLLYLGSGASLVRTATPQRSPTASVRSTRTTSGISSPVSRGPR